MKQDQNQVSTSIYAPGQRGEEYACQFCAFLVRYDHLSVNAGQPEVQEEVVGFSSPGIAGQQYSPEKHVGQYSLLFKVDKMPMTPRTTENSISSNG